MKLSVATRAKRFLKKFIEPPPNPYLQDWRNKNGDKTYRLFYELRPDSLVFDLGGYEGQWASDIFAMYQCSIFVFEPVEHFASNIISRFANNNHITIYPFGLSSETYKSSLSLSKDASSIYKSSGETTTIQLMKASDFLASNKIKEIDLMKINIEGGEYDLLEHLIESNWAQNIKNIQVQFHSFVPNAENRMQAIQSALSKTHSLTYQFPFVWENWRRSTDSLDLIKST